MTFFRLRIRTKTNKLCFICLIISFILICSLNLRSQGEDLESCFYEDTEFPVEKCIDGYFQGMGSNAGIGNIAFELLTFAAIAKESKRIPIVTHPKILKRFDEVAELFPNLYAYLRHHKPEKTCSCFKKTIKMHQKCCTVDKTSIISAMTQNYSTIRIHQTYTQTSELLSYGAQLRRSFKDYHLFVIYAFDKEAINCLPGFTYDHFEILSAVQGIGYLSLLSEAFVKKMMAAPKDTIRAANEDIFPRKFNRNATNNICIHIRRQDFITSPLVVPSESVFTQIATLFVLDKEGSSSDVYVFGDDAKFNTEVFRGWRNVYLARNVTNRPRNAEWEFSKLYCDVVLLTESASTYGWWMGYLSRGQKVYYNKNFSRPGGLEEQMTPSHFWPESWIPITITKHMEVIEDPW